MRKKTFSCPPLMHWFIDIIFTLQLISFSVHVWCPPSHGRFSSYFLYSSASHSSVCLEKISRINVYSSDFFLPPLSSEVHDNMKKIHLSCLISSIAWHFFLGMSGRMHTWGTLENWVLIYKVATAPWPQN